MTSTVTTNENIWYDKTPLLSHNALFNFVLGARGTGKTYCFKKWCVQSENQSVWVRRYREDIEDLLKGDKFVGDLIETGIITPEDEWEIYDDALIINGQVKIWFIALSTSKRKKSQSYFNVDKIIFDECLEEGTRYLKGEVENLLGLYETVNRLRVDGRKDCRVFLLANKVSFVNPYFAYWRILPFEQRFKKYKEGLILVENYNNEAFVKTKKETKFGKLIEGTAYGKYLIDNEVWRDDNAFIIKRPKDSKLIANIRYKELKFGLWSDNNKIYCCNDYNNEYIFYAPTFDIKEGEIPLDKKSNVYQWLIEAYKISCLCFDNNVIKEYVFDILQTGGKGVYD